MPGTNNSERAVKAMGEASIYPGGTRWVEHLQTHISHVFLADEYAYKLKKPLNLGFLDFATLEARRRYCIKELELNRRLAPELYLEVLALVEREGGPALVSLDEAGGDAFEYVLKMRRMDQDRMLDHLLELGRADEGQIRAVARRLAEFYAANTGGPKVAFYGRPEQVRINVEENFRQTEDYQDVSVAPARWRAIRDAQLVFLSKQWALLDRRVAEGRVVDGHGDLHSGNINLPPQGGPLIFDCIEFNERFRYQDAAADLAFLAMDLDFHGREDLSAALIDEYMAASGDRGLMEVLDFYRCYRAVVRAKINGFLFDDQAVPLTEKFRDLGLARAYWRLAARYAGGEPPYFLVCCQGLMGTGKSYLAKKLASATGWVRLSSDEVRKKLLGLEPGARRYEDWGRGVYGPGMGEATYGALYKAAQGRLAMGAGAIVDASFSGERWRRRFRKLARECGAQCLFLEVFAEREVVLERLARREAQGDSASDGRRELMDAQAASWEPYAPETAPLVLRVDGGRPLEEKLGAVMTRLGEMGYRPENNGVMD